MVVLIIAITSIYQNSYSITSAIWPNYIVGIQKSMAFCLLSVYRNQTQLLAIPCCQLLWLYHAQPFMFQCYQNKSGTMMLVYSENSPFLISAHHSTTVSACIHKASQYRVWNYLKNRVGYKGNLSLLKYFANNCAICK